MHDKNLPTHVSEQQQQLMGGDSWRGKSIKVLFGFMKQISINLANQFVEETENFKNSCSEGLLMDIDWR